MGNAFNKEIDIFNISSEKVFDKKPKGLMFDDNGIEHLWYGHGNGRSYCSEIRGLNGVGGVCGVDGVDGVWGLASMGGDGGLDNQIGCSYFNHNDPSNTSHDPILDRKSKGISNGLDMWCGPGKAQSYCSPVLTSIDGIDNSAFSDRGNLNNYSGATSGMTSLDKVLEGVGEEIFGRKWKAITYTVTGNNLTELEQDKIILINETFYTIINVTELDTGELQIEVEEGSAPGEAASKIIGLFIESSGTFQYYSMSYIDPNMATADAVAAYAEAAAAAGYAAAVVAAAEEGWIGYDVPSWATEVILNTAAIQLGTDATVQVNDAGGGLNSRRVNVVAELVGDFIEVFGPDGGAPVFYKISKVVGVTTDGLVTLQLDGPFTMGQVSGQGQGGVGMLGDEDDHVHIGKLNSTPSSNNLPLINLELAAAR